MNGRNTIVGGMPGQGKSSAARALMAGAALDPSCELRIWVPDANFDFELFKRRCSHYVMGAEDEYVEQILEACELLHEEIQARGRILTDMEEPEVTRKIADTDRRLRPLVTLLEEAHVAFQHGKFGKDISRLTVENVKLGRKRAVHQIVSTQAPTKDSIPRDVTRNCSNGLAFAVGDHVANDALLGQGAYRAGHRATELLPGVDRGVCLAKGLTGQRSELTQVHFVSITRDLDELTPLIDRAVDAVREYDATLLNAPAAPVSRDLLADLDEVLGVDLVPIADVPRMLRALAPSWPAYKSLNGKDLVAKLAELGVKVPSTGNKWPLDPSAVRRAVAERAANDE
jgi:S-DNA-T family DNA segregation ATPase FtsK/SpoIIIE